MYKFIKYYDIGFKEGMNMAISDNLRNKKRKFKIIKTNDIKSKLYDIGYIDGYKITHKKLTLNLDKNIV